MLTKIMTDRRNTTQSIQKYDYHRAKDYYSNYIHSQTDMERAKSEMRPRKNPLISVRKERLFETFVPMENFIKPQG
jgi:hypothetical protein